MSLIRFYRLNIWLPLVVPAALIASLHVLMKDFGAPAPAGPFRFVFGVLQYSLQMGGIPYALLALWATWEVGDQEEAGVRRLMYLSPLLMVAVFAVWCIVIGLISGHMRQWIAVAALGSAIILPLGYTYVGLTVFMRHLFKRRLTAPSFS